MIAFVIRLLELWRIAAAHRLDYLLANLTLPPGDPARGPIRRAALMIRLHPASWFSQPKPLSLKNALEEMGVIFLKGGQLLSTRRDLVPPEIIEQLTYLQDQITAFDSEKLKQIVEASLGKPLDQVFSRFDDQPLAAASIAQVHTAQLLEGFEVVVKVVRPGVHAAVRRDFALLAWLGKHLSERFEAARAMNLNQVISDYHRVMLMETRLTHEAANTRIMRENFLGGPDMYVPQVYFESDDVLINERIIGVPVSQTERLIELGVDLEALSKKGLKIFFTQLFRDNFFHADMHPGNVFVETNNPQSPRYIALDCAIVGSLSDSDRLMVARLLLAVMNRDFEHLVQIIALAGWTPEDVSKVNLARDMRTSIGPMISKPMDEIDFAGVLVDVLDMARRYKLTIPPSLMLLIKTLVHVEGMGRDLNPKLDIWSEARPIITQWINSQLSPKRAFDKFKAGAPDLLISSTELPDLAYTLVHNIRRQGAWQLEQSKALEQITLTQIKRNQSQTRFLVLLGALGLLMINLPAYAGIISIVAGAVLLTRWISA